MLWDIVHNLFLFTIRELHLYESAIKAYSLSTTTGHNTLVIHIVQSVLNGRRTAI